MQAGKIVLSTALAVAIASLFGAQAQAQLPTSCVAGGFTVTADPSNPLPVLNGLRWRYTVTGANTNKISLGVLVVPRPVRPSDIVSPAPLNYCQQSDTNTKINRGNCDGFPVNVPPQSAGGGAVIFDVITKNNVTQDLVTWNIVSGTGTTDVCLSNPTTGIVGPGDLFNPASIISTTQTFSSPANQCPVDVIRNSRGDIISVAFNANAAQTCGPITVTDVSQISVDGKALEFAGSGTPGGGIFALGSTHACMRLFDPSTGTVYLISVTGTSVNGCKT
ncbi:MAG TPA: hypothetical protein VNM15_06195 [Candidatus Binatia bacterium]|nr:hypothetical protein [Candidatus Binatia bacterium]